MDNTMRFTGGGNMVDGDEHRSGDQREGVGSFRLSREQRIMLRMLEGGPMTAFEIKERMMVLRLCGIVDRLVRLERRGLVERDGLKYRLR